MCGCVYVCVFLPMQQSHLLLLENGLFLQDFDRIELVICAVACQQNLAEAALADHFQEVEIAGLGCWVGGWTEVDLLGWTGLQMAARDEEREKRREGEEVRVIM